MHGRTAVLLPPAVSIVAGLAGLVSPAAAQRLAARSAVPSPSASIQARATVMPAPQRGMPIEVLEIEPPSDARWLAARTGGWLDYDGSIFIKEQDAASRGRVRLTLLYL